MSFLRKMLNSHGDRDGLQIRNKDNKAKGLCYRCDNPINYYGRNKTLCEYHWLKSKFIKINERVYGSNPSKYLQGIDILMTWKDLVEWAIEHPEYKEMEEPVLTRINMKDHFYPNNLQWMELKEASKNGR